MKTFKCNLEENETEAVFEERMAKTVVNLM